MSEYNRHRWAMEWMYGGGRDPNGRSLDDEIRIGKEEWMGRQRIAEGGQAGHSPLAVSQFPSRRVRGGHPLQKVSYATTRSGRAEGGQLVQPGPGRPGYSGKYEDTTVYKKRKEAIEKGLVYDLKTKEFRKNKKTKQLSKTNQKKILKAFPDADFSKGKLGFDYTTETKKYNNVSDFIRRDYKVSLVKKLPVPVRNEIMKKFSHIPAEEWDFDNFKFGLKDTGKGLKNEKIRKQIDAFINDPKPFKYAFRLEHADGWMLQQMDRAYMYGDTRYEPIYDKKWGKNKKIVGFIDNTKYGKGKKYFANENLRKQYGKGTDWLINKHTDFAKTKKFISIANEAKAAPSKALLSMFPEGFDTSRLKLNDLVRYLIKEKGVGTTRRAIELHHTKGVTGRATGGYQLLTRDLNLMAHTISEEIKAGNFKNIESLKKNNIRVVVDGKAYGAAPESARAGMKRIVSNVEKQVGTWGPKEFNKFRKFIKEHPKLATQAGMRLNSGLPIDEIMKMPGMKKALPWIKGEGYFAFADMLNNWSKGQSFWKGAGKGVEMATFGLVDFDTDEKAVLMHAVKRGVPDNEIKAMMDYLKYKKEEKRLIGLDTQLAYLDHYENIGGELSPSKLGYAGQEGYKYGDRERIIKGIAESEQNLEKLYNEYYTGDNRSATIGMVTLENMMESLTAEEWNKTAGIPGIDRGYREMIGAKGDEGLVWGPIFGSSMREFFESIGGEETDSLKKFQPQELMMEHPVYGYKEQIKRMEEGGKDFYGVERAPVSPMEDIREHFGYALGDGGRASYFNGGIASLKKK